MDGAASGSLADVQLQEPPQGLHQQEVFLAYLENFSNALRWQLWSFRSSCPLYVGPVPTFKDHANKVLDKFMLRVDEFRREMHGALGSRVMPVRLAEEMTDIRGDNIEGKIPGERTEIGTWQGSSGMAAPGLGGMRSFYEATAIWKDKDVPVCGVRNSTFDFGSPQPSAFMRDSSTHPAHAGRESFAYPVNSIRESSAYPMRESAYQVQELQHSGPFLRQSSPGPYASEMQRMASEVPEHRVTMSEHRVTNHRATSVPFRDSEWGQIRVSPSFMLENPALSRQTTGDDGGSSSIDAGHLASIDLSDEDEEESPSGPCFRGVLNPNYPGRLFWDLNTMLLVLMDAMILPFQMAYKDGEKPDGFDTFWLWATTSFFACDVFLNFQTAYAAGKRDFSYEPGKLVTSRMHIAKNYMRSWFPIDVVSTVPWGKLSNLLVGGGNSGAGQLGKLTKVVKFVRFMRLMRMLRLAKLAAIWERVEAKCGSIMLLQGVGLLRVLFVLVCICHWNACIWWMIGQPSSILTEILSEQAQNRWAATPHWTNIIRSHGPGEAEWVWLNRTTTEAYIFCFYWTLGVMRTMPAEVTPVNKAERIYIMVFMFFAFSAFAICVAQITQTFFKFSERRRVFNDDMAAVRMHLRKVKAADSLQMKIKGYLRHMFDVRRLNARETALIDRLPPHLNQALQHARLMPYLDKVDLFKGLSIRALTLVSELAEVKEMAPGDVVCNRDHKCQACWILIVGRLSASTGFGAAPSRIDEVVDDECLSGERTECPRSKCTVVCVLACSMVRIDRERFMVMQAKHPNFMSSGRHSKTGRGQASIMSSSSTSSPPKAQQESAEDKAIREMAMPRLDDNDMASTAAIISS